MSNERAERVKSLFLEAADLVGEDRERLLTERCGGDAAVRAEVERLLDADQGVNDRFLEGASQRIPVAATPSRIGRFRILGRIGEGGMGAVFEAEQDHPRRKVALKIIRRAMASESLLRRFEYEVQILGQLKHPGIAQIYEAGTHDDGGGAVPYFAMEFIQGSTLLKFIQRRGLEVRGRLELMIEICNAVHHAHQKGVIHRDLKPANILVEESHDGKGRPKILDFGVARAVHSDVQLLTMHTDAGQLIGTLSYMSPEQVAGRSEELDVRSDVYALGVILYEMLAGRLPYDLNDRSIAEAGSIVRGQEPTRLSSLDSSLRGDIETIVAKALAKEKDRRYASAAELGEDISRFLRDEPIVARPASRAYQVRKFAKRNKAMVGGVVAVFFTLVLGIVGTGVALLRAKAAERVALQRTDDALRFAAKAEAVRNFLQEMLSSVDPARALGREVTIRDALDEAAARIGSGLLAGEPDLDAELRGTLGTTYLAIGRYDDAETQLRAALETRRRLPGDEQSGLVGDLNNLALLCSVQGRPADAERLYREALAVALQTRGEKHAELASILQSLGAALRSQRRYAEAESSYKKALAMRRELLGAEHVDVAQTMNSLALLSQDRGDLAGAEPLFRDALAMRRRLLGDKHPVVAGALNNLANLLQTRGNDTEAESLLREALGMRRELLGDEHPDVAQSLNNLGLLLLERHDFQDAEPLYREALAIWRKTLPAGHTDLGNVTAGLGIVLNELGAFVEAESVLRESLAIRDSTYPEGHWVRFSARSALGAALIGQGRYAEAEPLLVQAYEGLKDQPLVAVKHKRDALERVIVLYESWDRPESAAQWRARRTELQR